MRKGARRPHLTEQDRYAFGGRGHCLVFLLGFLYLVALLLESIDGAVVLEERGYG